MFFGKKKKEKKQYYFDYAAATPIDDEVLSLLFSHLGTNFANPGALHGAGVESKKILQESRTVISGLISSRSDEIVFTSGGTESDVLALKGVVDKVLLNKNLKEKPHLIVSAIEHSAIFDTAKKLKDSGLIELSILSVDNSGRVDIDNLKNLIKESTVFISVMYVNNEIGVIQDIPSISKEIRRLKKKIHGDRSAVYPVFHTDASQAVGSLPVGVLSLGIDLMSFNSGKIYGPKGVGALFVKRKTPISSVFYSSGQEFGLRPGTEPVALIAGFAKAMQVSEKHKDKEFLRQKENRKYFLKELENISMEPSLNSLDLSYKINQTEDYTVPHIVHLPFKGLESDQLVIELDSRNIFVSAKSACKTLDPQTSHVLQSIGYKDNSWGSVRFSFGRNTNKDDIDFAIAALKEVLIKLLHTKKEFNL